MRPTALALNLVVAGFGALRYWRAGQTNLRLLARLRGRPRRPPPSSAAASTSRPNITGRWSASCSGPRRCACSGSRRGSPSASCSAPSLAITLPAGAGARPARRADRDRRRHLPQPADHPVRLGGCAADLGRRGRLHLPQLARRPGRQSRFGAGAAGRTADPGRGAVAAGALVGTWLGVGRLPKPSGCSRALGLVLVIAGAKLLRDVAVETAER